MEIKILKSAKEEMEFEIGSLTLAELLRVYLNEDDSVNFAAWKRDHPTEFPTMLVRAKDARKAVEKACSAATKDLEKFEKDFEKMK